MKSIYIAQYPYTTPVQIHSNTSDLGFVVNIPIGGLDFPDVRLTSFDKPGEDGAVVSNQFLSGRAITLDGRVSANTIAQYELNRRILEAVLSILRDSVNSAQPLLLQFTGMDNLSLQVFCYVSKKPTIIEKSLNHAIFHVELFAPDPLLYSQSSQLSTITPPSGGGVVYPVIYPVTYGAQTGGQITLVNNGNQIIKPIVTFTGPLTSPFINNLTTGEVFLLNLTLNSGDIMKCYMGDVVDDSGNFIPGKTMILNGITNGLPYFDNNNSWLGVKPGNNTIKLGTGLTSDSGNVQLQFRDGYIGK